MDILNDWLEDFLAIPELDTKYYPLICPLDQIKYAHLFKRVQTIRNLKCPHSNGRKKKQWSGRRSNLLGKTFERLIELIFRDSKVFRLHTRLQTRTGEIDILFEVLDPVGQKVAFLQKAGTHFLAEAKCHDVALKAEWVNETHGVCGANNTNLAILFTATESTKPLHARARDLIFKHGARGVLILPFGMKQLNDILGGKNILNLVKSQLLAVETDQKIFI